MSNNIEYRYREERFLDSLSKKEKQNLLNKKTALLAKEGWELENYIHEESKATFKRDINYKPAKKESVILIITIWIFGFFGILWFIGYINQEPQPLTKITETETTKQQNTINENKQKQNLDLTIKTIQTNDGFTLNNRQAVSISLIIDENNFIMLTLEKERIKDGYKYDSSIKNSTSQVSILASLQDKGNYRFYSTLNTLKVAVTKYREDIKEATFTIDTILNHTDNRKATLKLENIKFTVSGKDFNLLKFSKKDAEKEYESSRDYAIKNLTIIFTDSMKHENHFNNFQKITTKSNELKIFEKAKLFKYYAKKWVIQKYVDADMFGARKDKSIDELIKTTSKLAMAYQIYYASVMEYLDNQIPSKLLKVKENMQSINYYKKSIVARSIQISQKYNLEYSKTKKMWIKK